MTTSIEMKRSEIAGWLSGYPEQGHPHYWCGGFETDCDDCNMDHPKTELYLEMLGEERELLGVRQSTGLSGEQFDG